MTLNKIASMIAKVEGKKSQARIGDIREIVGIFADIVHNDESCEILNSFHSIGSKRAEKKAKSKKKASSK